MIHAGNNVQAIRKARGLTQSELADLAGVEQPTISKLERGSDSMTLRTLTRVAEALGVEVIDLFESRDDAERAIINAFRSLPPMRQRGWLDMAQAVRSESLEDQDKHAG